VIGHRLDFKEGGDDDLIVNQRSESFEVAHAGKDPLLDHLGTFDRSPRASSLLLAKLPRGDQVTFPSRWPFEVIRRMRYRSR
jgi:hypothetical protein